MAIKAESCVCVCVSLKTTHTHTHSFSVVNKTKTTKNNQKNRKKTMNLKQIYVRYKTITSESLRCLARQQMPSALSSSCFSSSGSHANICFRQFSLSSQIGETKSSVDDAETAKFRSLSPEWWIGPTFAPLRAMNHLRVPLIIDSFEQSNLRSSHQLSSSSSSKSSPIRLLDIGCGGGLLAEPLARVGASVTGIDPVGESIRCAIEHSAASFRANSRSSWSPSPPRYIHTTIESFARESENREQYDGVIISEVLEHIDESLNSFLAAAITCLRPGGRLFVTTINQTIFAYFGAILAAERLFRLTPIGTHRYDRLIPPDALRMVLEQDHRCSVRAVHGMSYNPFTGRWSWTQSQAINYAMVAVKL